MKYDLFLCHNSQDKPAVRAINEVLRQEYDLRTFLDESTLVGGEEWAAVIRDALADSAGCAVLLGESGWGKYQLRREARPAMTRQQADSRFRVIPVLLPGVVDAAMAKLPALFKSRQYVDFTTGVFDHSAVRALVFAARGENPFPEGKPQLTTARLRFDTIRWDAMNRRDDSILYTGAELRDAEALAAARGAELSDLVKVFLDASRERVVERRDQFLAAHASALAQDQLPLAARLAALALEHRPSPEAHAVLRRAAAWLPVTIKRLEHSDRVVDVVSSSDGSGLLTGAADGSVLLWDAERLEPLHKVRHESQVNTIAIDPDGEWFAAGGEDGNVSVWNAHDGSRLKTLSVGQPIARIDIGKGRDRRWLVAIGGEMLPGSPGTAVAWDCSTWEQAWRNQTVRDAAIAAGGSISVLAINDHFAMVNNASGTVAGDAALDGQVTAVAAHPTAPVFLATTLTGSVFRIAIDGKEFQGGVIRQGALQIERATFSPDGSRVAIFGSDLQLTIFGPSGLELSVPYEGMFGLRISFAPLRSLVSIHSAEAKTTTIWHTSTRTKVGVLATEGTAGATFGFPPRLAVAVAEHAVEVVRLPAGEEARWALGAFLVVNIMFSPDGGYVARDGSPVAPDGRVEIRRHALEVIDANSGAIVARLEELAEFRVRGFEGSGTSLVFEKNGQLMVLDIANQEVRAADAPIATEPEPRVAGAELNAPEVSDAIRQRGMKGSSISPDGRWLCVLHDRHMFSLWDVTEMKETLLSSTVSDPGPVVFSSQGGMVAVGDGRGNVIVSSTRGVVVARFKHAEPILRMLFSPDDRFLAVASVDSAFRLWPVSLDALTSQIGTPLTLDREEWSAYMGDEPYPS